MRKGHDQHRALFAASPPSSNNINERRSREYHRHCQAAIKYNFMCRGKEQIWLAVHQVSPSHYVQSRGMHPRIGSGGHYYDAPQLLHQTFAEPRYCHQSYAPPSHNNEWINPERYFQQHFQQHVDLDTPYEDWRSTHLSQNSLHLLQ